MTYKLYYSAGTCSMAVHVLLNELGQSVELIDTSLKEGKNRTPEFLKINPRAQVPVLVDGDIILREGAAILTYLAEKHGSALLPKSGLARAKAQEWLAFANSTMHPAYGRCFWLNKTKIDDAAKAELLKLTVENINNLWRDVEANLEHSDYIAGAEITLADILLTVIANWSVSITPQPQIGPRTRAMFKRVSERPAYQAALKHENVTYQMAA
jgi:glutathione S-transferase